MSNRLKQAFIDNPTSQELFKLAWNYFRTNMPSTDDEYMSVMDWMENEFGLDTTNAVAIAAAGR